MIIRYKRWQFWLTLALGIVFSIQPIYGILLFDKIDFWFLAELGLSLFFIFIAIYHRIKGYVVIRDGTITTYQLRARTLRLSEVEQYYTDVTGDYCLVAGKTKLRINPEWIEKESLEELLEILDEVAVRLN